MSTSDKLTLLPLRSSDLSQLKKQALNRDSLGEGRVDLPWYWRVNLDIDNDTISPDQVHKEYIESLRVQWFRGRARFQRWQEEVHWLQREAASIILDFRSRSEMWAERSRMTQHNGWKCYGLRQSRFWSNLAKNAYGRLIKPVKDGSTVSYTQAICQRVVDIYSQS
ncbi:unnamed protein product [Rhizoctonia solani]|uniref:Uncharacterized protein n=1 Tax=Rhizoctonia solani TaxID=456999 RepID=A0A8H3BJ15_9AGAM|nr:unnamed protein product [Rhizoctonia solani]